MAAETRLLFASGFAALAIAGAAAQEIHYSPDERLDALDAGLLSTARQSIDLAAFTLTDATVLGALLDAEKRGVAIRIIVDARERQDIERLGEQSANVRVRQFGA